MTQLSFSSVIIRGSALHGQNPIELHLRASPAFPACAAAYYEHDRHPVPDSWAARDVSGAEGTLELNLANRISEGRIGVTYTAQVVSAFVGGADVSTSLPAELCLKFAKVQYGRSLAREAWFYEQLSSCQGIAVARCFGFFSSTFAEQKESVDTVIPWMDLKHLYKPPIPHWMPVPSADYLPDDDPDDDKFHDRRGFKYDSVWNFWNPSESDPTVAVLLLEKLGESCNKHWKIFTWPREGLREELVEVVEDVCAYGVVHDDVTAFNLLRHTGPTTEEHHCPRHNVVHNWRVIDFDRSWVLDLERAGWYDKAFLRCETEQIGRVSIFWGRFLE